LTFSVFLFDILAFKKLDFCGSLTFNKSDLDTFSEYCGNGDLSRYIRAHQSLPEPVCRRFLQQGSI
jgi:hypothetical protein